METNENDSKRIERIVVYICITLIAICYIMFK